MGEEKREQIEPESGYRCMRCQKLKAGDANWLTREMIPELYDRLVKMYRDKGRLSSVYCPECKEFIKEHPEALNQE